MAARISVGFSDELHTTEAFTVAARRARAGLGGPPYLCVAFVGAPHLPGLDVVNRLIASELAPRTLIGCGAAGVVGPGREIEDGPGAVVWAAELPGAEIETFHATGVPGTDAELLDGLPEPDGTTPDAALVLADPYSFASDALLARINAEWPGMPVLGGLASAAVREGPSLLLDGELVDEGAVGCLLRGVDLIPCVSQGATPVGPEIAITEAEGNVIHQLAFRPAIERLGEVVSALEPAEREQASNGMLVGVPIDENRPEHGRGDFLVRPIIGADRETGSIAIGQEVRTGQTIRLHVRDGFSADADLREALALQVGAVGNAGAAGALLFTCNGRGRDLFGVADHDAEAVTDALGAPLGGFFCAGEIGPVGGRNFLHGFTATLAVFAAE
jgi:small ligand-binding sensory domain FIST